MENEKIVAVVGATGAQGGGLVDAILSDPGSGFSVRAITRELGSDKAQALAARGAELVVADIDDEASIARALQGAHAAYFVTFFWDHFSPDREKLQARNMARAARAAGIQHAIWSTLEDTRQWVPLSDTRMPTLMGEYKVPHFDAKGESNKVFTELGVPTTFLYTSFYWDNLVKLGSGPTRGADGKLTFTLPMGDSKLPGIAAEDIGKCAFGVFRQGDQYIGKNIGVAGEHLSGAEMAARLTEAMGEEVVHNAVSPETYRGFGFPGADDLGNMFQFKRDFEADFCARRDVEVSRALNPGLQTFETWLARNQAHIPV